MGRCEDVLYIEVLMALRLSNTKRLSGYLEGVVSYLGLVYAVLGFANQNYFHWVNSFWLSHYSEKIAIILFGIWRVYREKNPYTRKRIAVLTFFIAALWTLFPYLTGSSFFNHHLIGSVWFFVYLVIVFCMGRRADCSWNCPCVGIRDTAGNAFRSKTVKGGIFWHLRHVKWLFLASLILYFLLVVISPRSIMTQMYIGLFWMINLGLYFLSLLVIPWTGNRNYCRYLCPWGTLYGVIGKLGFFRILADRDRCAGCRICESVCDMGLPIVSLIQKNGEIRTTDCVGCGRCVTECPKEALRMVDIRDTLRKGIFRKAGSWSEQ